MTETKYRFLDENKSHIHQIDQGAGWKNLWGTTNILQVISKPLTWWASGMACKELGWQNPLYDAAGNKIARQDKAALELRRNECVFSAGVKLADIKGMETSEYMALLNKAYRAHSEFKEKRAEEGVDLHTQAEDWIKWKMGTGIEPLLIDPRLKPFTEWAEKNVKRFLFSEVHCFSEELWVGGICDFAYEDMNGKLILADIKSRDKVYFSDMIQDGAYSIQLKFGGLDKEGNTIWEMPAAKFDAIAVFPLTEKFKAPVIEENVALYEDCFRAALTVFKAREVFESDPS